MACDINMFIQIEENSCWTTGVELPRNHAFCSRSYRLFGFMANVRNYSLSPYIDIPRGLPLDISPSLEALYYDPRRMNHSASWLLLSELLDFDYDQLFWDRRIERRTGIELRDDALAIHPDEGKIITMREHIGIYFIEALHKLAKTHENPNQIRLVFWFDN